MWLPIAALVFAFVVVRLTKIAIPPALAKYVGVAILAGLDALVGGFLAMLEDHFSSEAFLIGLVGNVLTAILLAYVGTVLGLDLVLAVAVALGISLFWHLMALERRLAHRLAGDTVPDPTSRATDTP